MGQVSVTLNGRTYRLRCGDGEEERLLTVVAHVRGHVDTLIAEHGQIGDDRLLLMAGIMITDELFELRELQRLAAGTTVISPAAEAMAPVPPRHPLPSNAAPAAAMPAPMPLPASVAMPASVAISSPAHRESMLPSLPAGVAPARVRMPVPAGAAQPQPVAPIVPASPTSAPPRPLEHLDATALMKGIERKTGRS